MSNEHLAEEVLKITGMLEKAEDDLVLSDNTPIRERDLSVIKAHHPGVFTDQDLLLIDDDLLHRWAQRYRIAELTGLATHRIRTYKDRNLYSEFVVKDGNVFKRQHFETYESGKREAKFTDTECRGTTVRYEGKTVLKRRLKFFLETGVWPEKQGGPRKSRGRKSCVSQMRLWGDHLYLGNYYTKKEAEEVKSIVIKWAKQQEVQDKMERDKFIALLKRHRGINVQL